MEMWNGRLCTFFFFFGLSSSSLTSLFTFFVGSPCFAAGLTALPASIFFFT